jgi:TolB-like protein/cytochrome c-type biogenesis protein CcmH/NrfG
MDGGQFSFGRFRLDLERRRLLRDEQPVRLGSRALEILCVLASAEGRVVSKNDLMAQVWRGTVVEENNLHVHISALRKALDQGGGGQSYLVTVPGRGYRFIGFEDSCEPELGTSALRQRMSLSEKLASHPPAAMSMPSPTAAPRLSIVVLPFANLSDDKEQQYFADGLTDDLTTDLSRIPHMFVISRNTAFTYRDKPVSAKQIGLELGVRYVLEGSVRRSGNQLRVSAQLVDAVTDAHLWAERFDGDMGDLFTLQNEITSRLANALNIELLAAEAARPTEHPDALDYMLRGRAALLKSRTPESCREAIDLFERAVALDPQSVEAQVRLAFALVIPLLDGLADPATVDLARAERLINQALTVSPRFAFGHVVKGHVLRALGRREEAIREYEAALERDRNFIHALSGIGWCKLYAGSIEEVIPLVKQAIRLSPRDPGIGWLYYLIGIVYLLQSHTHEAIDWLEKARSAMPTLAFVRSSLASAYAHRGEAERATTELNEARRLDGGDRFSSIARLKAFPGTWEGAPKIRALFEDTVFAGLRKAGMPEE